MVTPDNRVCHLVKGLELTLTDFIRDRGVTHAEYRRAIDVIVASVKAGEASLLFDVFLEAASVDVDNARQRGTTEAIEGPFYIPGAPMLKPPYQLPQRVDEGGQALIFNGRVIDVDGEPIAHAELDIWQADAAGRYSNVRYSSAFPAIPAWNLRGRLKTEPDGSFTVTTILPPPYEIPKHGPTGTVLAAIGRHVYRPAHLHVKVRHPEHRELTVQLYFRGGPYLDSDVAHAVRDSLIVDLKRKHLLTFRYTQPTSCLVANFDFTME